MKIPRVRKNTALTWLVAGIGESARHLNGLTVTFLGFLLYLLVTVGTMSDRDILLGIGAVLPLLNAEVPLRWFFVFAALIILSLHLYVLLHLGRLRSRLFYLFETIDKEDETASVRIEQRHYYFPFFAVEIFLWRLNERRYLRWLLTRTLYFGAYAAFPVLALVLLQVKALKVHELWLWIFLTVVLTVDCLAIFIGMPIRSYFSQGKLLNYGEKYCWAALMCLVVSAMNWFFVFSEDTTCTEYWLPRHLALPGEVLSDGSQVLDLRGRNLHCADLRGATLNKADFRGANLERARFVGASLNNSIFLPSDISRERWSRIPDKMRLKEARDRQALTLSESSVAILSKADFSWASLSGAQLSLAHMEEVKLVGADLAFADLSGVVATEANFSYAQLEGVRLDMSLLGYAILDHARLTGSSIRQVDASRSSWFQSDAQLVDFTGSTLWGSSFVDADLTGSRFNEGDLSCSDFRGAVLGAAEGVTLKDSLFVHADFSFTAVKTEKGVRPFYSDLRYVVDDRPVEEIASGLRGIVEETRAKHPTITKSDQALQWFKVQERRIDSIVSQETSGRGIDRWLSRGKGNIFYKEDLKETTSLKEASFTLGRILESCLSERVENIEEHQPKWGRDWVPSVLEFQVEYRD